MRAPSSRIDPLSEGVLIGIRVSWASALSRVTVVRGAVAAVSPGTAASPAGAAGMAVSATCSSAGVSISGGAGGKNVYHPSTTTIDSTAATMRFLPSSCRIARLRENSGGFRLAAPARSSGIAGAPAAAGPFAGHQLLIPRHLRNGNGAPAGRDHDLAGQSVVG